MEYCVRNMTTEPAYLEIVERNTHLKTLAPQMLSGKLQGRFLSMISKMVSPKKILEIGAFTGYSALCLAEGLANDGILHTIEINPELEQIIHTHFEMSPFNKQLQLHIGDALELLPKIHGPFDLVFIDAAKELYSEYYEKVIDKVRPHGILIVDNILWDDKVLSGNPDRETRSIMSFNERVLRDTRVDVLPLPIRDGISIIRKKE